MVAVAEGGGSFVGSGGGVVGLNGGRWRSGGLWVGQDWLEKERNGKNVNVK